MSETAAANLAENGTSASEGIVLTGPKTKHRKQFDQIDAEFRERIDRIERGANEVVEDIRVTTESVVSDTVLRVLSCGLG